MKNINMQKEVDSLLNEFGVNILYIRRNPKINCKCYDELYKTGKSDCSLCFGTGKQIKIEVLKVINSNDRYYSKLSGAGRYFVSIDNFIFNAKSNIKYNDLFMYVGYKNNIATDVKNVYRINNISEVRGDNGKLEYYEVDASSDSTLINKYNSNLKKINYRIKDNNSGSRL